MAGFVRGVLKRLQRSRVFGPILTFGKRHVYRHYRSSQLVDTAFPAKVWIENTNHCNAKCAMCPRETHDRKQGIMDFSLFEKIVSETARHAAAVERVHLHNFGEPLVDKRLVDRIRFAKESGIRHVYFVTNGALLNDGVAKGIIEAGLDEMKISFYGTDRDTYNKTMVGLDFEKTLANVRRFFEIRGELGRRNPKVVVQYLPQETNRSRVKEFEALVAPLLDPSRGDSFYIFELHNYGGGRDYVKLGAFTRICPFPWSTIVILHDGRVVMCSPDYNGLNVVGDVREQTIAEVWNGERYRRARAAFRRLDYRDYPACAECTVVRDYLSESLGRFVVPDPPSAGRA
ncbi:radical SAM/SPASM domain-containing protein [Elusimicrobiota bacterium]